MFSICKRSNCSFIEWFGLFIIALLTVIATALITIKQFNGVNQEMISTHYYTMMVPANFTFQIWALIYTSWILLGMYQAYISCSRISWIKRIREKIWGDMSISKCSIITLSVVMCLTVLWLLTWHLSNIALSLIIMSAILAVLSYWWYSDRSKSTKYTSWVMELTTGWIIVAIIANLGAFLVSADVVPDMISHRMFIYMMGLPILTAAIGFFFYTRSQIALGVLTWSILWLLSARSGESVIQIILIILLVISVILNMFLGEKTIKI